MQAPFDNIVQHLFHQPSLHSVTVEELEQMAQQHPYFAAAQFLLLKKMQATSHPLFTSQLHRTTIYFNNPLWLQYLLQPETTPDAIFINDPPFIETTVNLQPATQGKIQTNTIENRDNQPDPDQPVPALTQETALTQQFAEPVLPAEPAIQEPAHHHGVMDIISEIFSDANPLYNPVEPVDDVHDEHLTTDDKIEAEDKPVITDTSTHELVGDASASEPSETKFIDSKESIAVPADKRLLNETAAEPVENTAPVTAEATIQQDNQPAEQSIISETESDPIKPEEEPEENESLNTNKSDPVSMADDTAFVPDEHTNTTMLTTSDSMPLLKDTVETPASKNDLLFEPFHTVDYFASQGIKLGKLEPDAKDKLGRQLKSFTEWLKTMKKLPQVSIDNMLAENEESKVVADANHSLESKEVVTQAMAEVFEKQGMHEKAAGIYKKLSLQDPGKSAYFAARIEALKH